LEGDWQIWKVFCNTLTRDFRGYLGARALKNVRKYWRRSNFSRSIV